jgi:hypothetical protein
MAFKTAMKYVTCNMRAIVMIGWLVWLIMSGRLPLSDTWAFVWAILAVTLLIRNVPDENKVEFKKPSPQGGDRTVM